MLISEPLPLVRAYLEALDEQLRTHGGAQRGLSRLQRHWSWLLQTSVTVVLQRYGISHGVLILDEVTNPRAKVTERLGYAHKIKHPGSGGFVNGQSLVMLLLVTERVTIPVDVRFYQPDPLYQRWRREDKRRRREARAQAPTSPASGGRPALPEQARSGSGAVGRLSPGASSGAGAMGGGRYAL